MPAPRVIDQLPQDLLDWLHDELRARGFADYYGLAKELNKRLADEGIDLVVRKSALAEYGRPLKEAWREEQHKRFIARQVVSTETAAEIVAAITPQDELTRHKARHHRIEAMIFEALETPEGAPPLSPKEMVAVSRASLNMLKSSEMQAAFRQAIAAEQAEKLDAAQKSGKVKGLTAETVEEIKRKILGVE
jgi:hypothetical protein